MTEERHRQIMAAAIVAAIIVVIALATARLWGAL